MRKLYTLQDLRDRSIAYHPEHLRRLEKLGKFPCRVSIGGGRAMVWEAEAIDKYLAERIEAARGRYLNRHQSADAAA